MNQKKTQPSEYQRQYIAMLNRVAGSIDDPTFTETNDLQIASWTES